MSFSHLTFLYDLYQKESQPFRKVHRMIDLFESIIKTHTAVIISEYVQHNNLSEAAKGLLSQGLRTPSLGTWQLFSRVLFEELEKDQFQWSISNFREEFAALDKALNNEKTNVIAFRNGYAHGATPSDEACMADISKFESFLLKLLQSQWLQESSLDVRVGKVCLCSSNTELSLHPILIFRDEKTEASFAFFNDIKNDKIGLLNYPLGKHYREKDFYQEFLSHLPLNEWKKSGNNVFYQRIEELTESFKGRTIERKRLLDFVVEKNKGYFSIQGNPGIGKSALIAQFFKDLKGFKEAQNFSIVEYFIRRGTQQAQAEYLFHYLIKRTDELFPQGREIRAEGKLIFDLQNQLFSKWRQWNEHSQGKKLIFLIDGLDEGTEANVPVYLPRENFENVLIIYGSRLGGHKSIDDLWGTLPPEHHEKLELTGLGKEDIRALIYEVANKYEVERESAWIDAVQQRSQGNPLYLKLLCDAIENNGIVLNDIQALPTKIDEYYKAILLRYANDVDGDDLLSGLHTFAAAKDYLTMSHLGLINGIGSATVIRIGSTLKEVLYENPLTEEVLDYQMFHESFREYLVKEQAREVSAAQQRIIAFCAGWKELKGDWEQRYALEHYAAHLHESAKEQHGEILLNLIYDKEYQATQKIVLRGFEATNALFRLSLLKASDVKRYDDQLEAALCLVDLKYEEANDAPQIVAMVAAGEIDLALKRIESFGGADKEGLQRKFILYMLCLMELTLLESKDKPFRKEAIEKLLKHLDDQLPTDHSILNWNDFFPSYLMFQMACVCAELGMNYLLVYKRTDDWENDWISEKGRYTDLQVRVMVELVSGISSDWQKCSVLNTIAADLSKQGQLEKSLILARGISDDYWKCCALTAIAEELSKQRQIEESALLLQESINIARGISDWQKSSALLKIASAKNKQGQIEESGLVIQQSLVNARGISDGYWKSRALNEIAKVLYNWGQEAESASIIHESLAIARLMSDERDKTSALNDIIVEMFKQGQVEESLAIAAGISINHRKIYALMNDISSELSKQGQLEESLVIARGISDAFYKISALNTIAIEISKLGQAEESALLIKESLDIVRGIGDVYWKSRAFTDIVIALSKQGQVEESASVMKESLAIARGISGGYCKSRTFKDIAIALSKQGQVKESLVIAREISDAFYKISTLNTIAIKISNQGQAEESASVIQESLTIAHGIGDGYWKSRAFKDIAIALSKQGHLEETLDIIRGMSSDWLKSHSLSTIAAFLSKKGQVEESVLLMNESLVIASGLSDNFYKSSALNACVVGLFRQGHLDEALAIARGIRSEWIKSSALNSVALALNQQGHLEESASVMQESRAFAQGIKDDYYKSGVLKEIAVSLSKLGQVQESLVIARGLSVENDKESVLREIAIVLIEQGNYSKVEAVILEITQIAQRQDAWKDIAKTRVKTGGWQNALEQVEIFKTEEAKLFYLKGWAENVKLTDVNDICIQQALPIIGSDNSSTENLLQKYAVNLVVMGKPSRELTDRLNRTLNIQWALDIAAQFPIAETKSRLSTNLESWLHEIADEDDREQIELWAKQVAKGKITEEEFEIKIKDLN